MIWLLLSVFYEPNQKLKNNLLHAQLRIIPPVSCSAQPHYPNGPLNQLYQSNMGWDAVLKYIHEDIWCLANYESYNKLGMKQLWRRENNKNELHKKYHCNGVVMWKSPSPKISLVRFKHNWWKWWKDAVVGLHRQRNRRRKSRRRAVKWVGKKGWESGGVEG